MLEYSVPFLGPPNSSAATRLALEENLNTDLKDSPKDSYMPALALPHILSIDLQPYWLLVTPLILPGCSASEPRKFFPLTSLTVSLWQPFCTECTPSITPPLPLRPPQLLFSGCHSIMCLFAELYSCCLLHCNVRSAVLCPCCVPSAWDNVCTQ